MRIDKKIRKYIEQNGNYFENYKELCKVLREDEKSGKAKTKQLERWELYFSYSRKGHGYVIGEVYDDATIRRNEQMFQNRKKENNMHARSKYRKELIEVLKKLIYDSENKTLFLPMISIAIACGFFNESIKGTTFYKDYMIKREIFKSNNPEKKYYKYDMSYFNYNIYITQIKNNAYEILTRTLETLKANDMIDYHISYQGEDVETGEQRELSIEEVDKYEEIQEKTLSDILALYNEVAKEPKESITRRDILFYKDLREKYYEELENNIKEELGLEKVIPFHFVCFTSSFEKKLDEGGEICTDEQYLEYRKNINKKSITNLQKNLDKNIKKNEDFHCEVQVKSLEWTDDDSYIHDYKYYKDMSQQEQAYYNKIEIIENSINIGDSLDIIDLKEYRKQKRGEIINNLLEEYEGNKQFDDTFFTSSDEDLQMIKEFLN